MVLEQNNTFRFWYNCLCLFPIFEKINHSSPIQIISVERTLNYQSYNFRSNVADINVGVEFQFSTFCNTISDRNDRNSKGKSVCPNKSNQTTRFDIGRFMILIVVCATAISLRLELFVLICSAHTYIHMIIIFMWWNKNQNRIMSHEACECRKC